MVNRNKQEGKFNPKKVLIHCLYFVVDFTVLFLSLHDVVTLISSPDMPQHLAETSHLASLNLLISGWFSFFILLITNFLIFKYFFRLALGFGVFANFLVLINLFITLGYEYNGTFFLSLYIYTWMIIVLSIANILIYSSIKNITDKEKTILKKTILNLGTRFIELEIRDISEKSYLNIKKVKDLVKEMIENNEIYATYNEYTKLVQFDQDANLEEIDKLMQIYESWEKDLIEKKK